MASLARVFAAVAAFSGTPWAFAADPTCSIGGPPNAPCTGSFAEVCRQMSDDGSTDPGATLSDPDQTAWEALLTKCPQCDADNMFQQVSIAGPPGEVNTPTCAAANENFAPLSEQECEAYAQHMGFTYMVATSKLNYPCGCGSFPDHPVPGTFEQVTFFPDGKCAPPGEDSGEGFLICKSAQTSPSPFTCSKPARLYAATPRVFGATAIPVAAGSLVILLLFLIVTVVRRRSAGRSLVAQIDEGFSTDAGSHPHVGQDPKESVLIARA